MQPLIVVGYGFDLKEGSYFLLDDQSMVPTRRSKMYLQSKLLYLTRSHILHCTGRYHLATHTPQACPAQAVLYSNTHTTNCRVCYLATGFHPGFDAMARERLSLQQQAYNQDAHCVYLAYFASGLIKVGIAHYKRYYSRLLEQGARAGCMIKLCSDAYAARKFEKEAIKKGIKGSITRKRKIDYLLHSSYSVEEAEVALRREWDYLYNTMEDVSIAPFSGIKDFQKVYFPDGQPNLLTVPYVLDDVIKGTVGGMIGSFLIIQKDGCYGLLDIKPLLGKLIVEMLA